MSGKASDGEEQTQQTSSRLVQLPREIILQIVKHLPLASRLIFERQVCRSLRLESAVTFEPPYRCSLATLLEARTWLQRKILGNSNGGVSPPASKGTNKLLGWSTQDELSLLIKAIRKLFPQMDGTSAGRIRSIVAIGLRGIPGDRMAQILAFEDVFANVETVVKSDHLDATAWTSLDFSQNFNDPSRREAYLEALSLDMDSLSSEWRSDSMSSPKRVRQDALRALPRLPGEADSGLALGEGTPEVPKEPDFPVRTQASVHIGSKGPPVPVIGQGLHIGYDSLCFVRQCDVHGSPDPFKLRHVIFQGRYRGREAFELEQMLEWSDVTCVYCKEIIHI